MGAGEEPVGVVTAMHDVLGIGCCALDVILETPRYPGPDEKVKATHLRVQGGGLVATALVAVARLGGRAAWVGAIGDDALAQGCLDELRREGVDVGHVRQVPGQSVLTAAVVCDASSGARTIVWTDAAHPATMPEQVTEALIRGTRVLHVDNFQLPAALKAARIARRLGVPVTVDLEPGGGDPDELLRLVDYAIVPLELARQRYGAGDMREGACSLYEAIAPHGGRMAVVTAGQQGSYAVGPGLDLHQPAYRVDVIDTTGCGDVFHGAFALRVAEDAAPGDALSFAAATAALKCRALGGRTGIPSRREVEEFLAAGPAVVRG